MERRDAVQGIWDGLKDKSKVITATSLVKITCDADGVTAEASDGQVFHGDIIIGADGVHSRVQQEMQRIAAADRPGFDLFPDKDGHGVFGVAQGVDGISSSEAAGLYNSSFADNHQIHPISGLGGNSAILSAASLGNQLHAFIGKKPSEADLQKAFQAYQKERTWHVQAVVKFAHYLQVSDALDSPLSLFMKRVILPLIPSASFLNMHATILVPSIRVDHVPLPNRARLVPFEDEVKIKPADRPRLISLVWIALLVAAFWLLYPLQQVSELNSTWTTSPLPRLRNGFEIDISLYLQLSLTAITSIMCLESYRLSFSVLSILGS
ncbi:hypothetical protein N7470_002510 [Penicillium chermesinum]|nr:hypothetical protein N7470_002510 [Penicillium chermesinum]